MCGPCGRGEIHRPRGGTVASVPRTDVGRVRRTRVAAGALGIALGSVVGLLVPLPLGFRDMFHVGEFFVGTVTVATGSPAGTPYTVHGALDVVPGLVTRAFFGADAYVVPTIVLYLLLALTAMLLFVVILARLLPGAPSLWPVMAVAGFATSWSVHYRDLLLVAGILAFTLTLQAAGARARAWWASATGVAVTLGVLWSWNRGLIGAVAILGAALIVALTDRARRSVLLVVAASAVAALVLAAFPLFRPDVVVGNIALVVEGNALTHYAWDSGLLRVAGFLAVPVVLAVVALGVYLWAGRRSAQAWAQSWLWAVVLAGLVKVALDRIDVIHLVMALWAPIAIGALAGPAVVERVPRWLRVVVAVVGVVVMIQLADGYPPLLAITALAAALLTAPWLARPVGARTAVAVVSLAAVAWYGWQVASPRAEAWTVLADAARAPTQADAVPEGVAWAAEQLRGQPCVLDLTSQGVINALVDLPTCTRFGYLPWVPATRQEELRAQVEATDPDVIVWSRGGGQFAIGSQPLDEQLGEFVGWLESEYPVEVCRAETCLRTRI